MYLKKLFCFYYALFYISFLQASRCTLLFSFFSPCVSRPRMQIHCMRTLGELLKWTASRTLHPQAQVGECWGNLKPLSAPVHSVFAFKAVHWLLPWLSDPDAILACVIQGKWFLNLCTPRTCQSLMTSTVPGIPLCAKANQFWFVHLGWCTHPSGSSPSSFSYSVARPAPYNVNLISHSKQKLFEVSGLWTWFLDPPAADSASVLMRRLHWFNDWECRFDGCVLECPCS